MPGDVSRDFAESLSKLHYEVETLKKQNKTLMETVQNLCNRFDKDDAMKAKHQRDRVVRAAFAQDPEEITTLKSQTNDPTELELLRMFAPSEPTAMQPIKINQKLLEGMQRGMKDKTVELIEVEEEPVVPYVLSDEYKRKSMIENQRQAELLARQQREQRAMQIEAETRSERNALKKLSPLWDVRQ